MAPSGAASSGGRLGPRRVLEGKGRGDARRAGLVVYGHQRRAATEGDEAVLGEGAPPDPPRAAATRTATGPRRARRG